MFRIRIKRRESAPVHALPVTRAEALVLAAEPGVLVLAEPMSPPGFPGSVFPATDAQARAYETARMRAAGMALARA